MLNIGDRVVVRRNADSWLQKAIWWPVGDVVGNITRICKNCSVYVACDFMPNNSEDGKRTKVFTKGCKVTIELV